MSVEMLVSAADAAGTVALGVRGGVSLAKRELHIADFIEEEWFQCLPVQISRSAALMRR